MAHLFPTDDGKLRRDLRYRLSQGKSSDRHVDVTQRLAAYKATKVSKVGEARAKAKAARKALCMASTA